MTALDRFITTETDEERLSLGLDILRTAYKEAKYLIGWQVEIYEYIHALETKSHLNRPLDQPPVNGTPT